MTDAVELIRQRIARAAAGNDITALADAYRELLLARPGDPQTRENAAAVALMAGRVSEACDFVQGVHGFRLLQHALIDPERARASEGAYVAVLDNVVVETHDWSILDGDKVYSAEAHCRNMAKSPWVESRVSPAGEHYLFKLPAPSRRIEEPCVYLGGDANYAHWIQRNLLKLALIEGTPYENWPLLLNEELTSYQREFLEMLAIPDSRLVKVPRGAVIECRQLVVPTNLAYSPRLATGVQWLRRKLAAWIDPGPPRGLLYLSRADARARKLVNERELEEVLGALGFESVIAGKLSVKDQIRTVSAARFIVAPHGAALANLVFAPPGATLVELNTGAKSHMTDFTSLAAAAGLRHGLMLSEDYDRTRPEPYEPDTDFRVDVRRVVKALQKLAPELFD